MKITNKNLVFDKDTIGNIAINIDSIFKNYFLPHEKILCIGDVQSGKTRQIINSLKNAKNYGYKVTIILCGHTNYLFEQTQNRLNRELKIEEGYESIDFDTIHQDLIIKNLHIIIPILKSRKIKNLLDNLLRIFKQHFTLEEGILIVDDECDSYSLLSQKKEKEEAKKIAQYVSNFYDDIVSVKKHKVKYLAVTATPFDNIKFFSFNKYDRSILLSHPKEYTGNEYFNELENFYITVPSHKDDKSTWSYMIKSALASWFSNSYAMLNDENNKIKVRELKNKIRNPEEEEILKKLTKSQFIININTRTPSHEEMFKMLSDIFLNFNYDELIQSNNFVKKDFDEFLNKLKHNVMFYIMNNNKCKFILINNNFKKAEFNEFINGEKDFQIIIGGNIISRGLTFEYLLTEIMLSAPNNKCQCDTLLQKARWFGYRQLTSKYMHVFTNENIRSKYENAQRDLDFIHEYGNNITMLTKYRGGEV